MVYSLSVEGYNYLCMSVRFSDFVCVTFFIKMWFSFFAFCKPIHVLLRCATLTRSVTIIVLATVAYLSPVVVCDIIITI